MIRDILIKYSSLSNDDIEDLLGRAPTTYAIYYIKKHNGKGFRQICQPPASTKMMQYCLMNLFLSRFSVHEKALAYHAGISSPLAKNAAYHKDYHYSVHCDYKDFFPSIIPEDLYTAIRRAKPGLKLSQDDKDVLKRVCFIQEKEHFHLTIGSPISPMISNIVMKNHDEYFDNFAKAQNNSYSRYADDIWYSSNDENACSSFMIEIELFLKENFNDRIILNVDKTRYYKPGQPKHITGLTVINNSVKVPRHIKRYVRSLIYKNDLTQKQKLVLQGYLSYIRANEPSYLNTLVMKYNYKYFLKLKQ